MSHIGHDDGDMKNVPDHTKWIRLPKAGILCPYSGFSRASLYLIAKRPEVESRKIYPTEGRRGLLIIRLDSLLAFIDRQASFPLGDDVSHQQSGDVALKAPEGSEEGGAQ